MKRAIVTGATSFIGISLIKQLIKNEYDVLAVVRPHSKNLHRLSKYKTIQVIELNIDDINMLPTIAKEKYDIFFHLAWEGTRAPYRDNEKLQIKNYFSAINAIHVANQLNCNIFIGSGSQAEYGQFCGEIDESYRTIPITEYGKAKLKTYHECQHLAENLGMQFVWARIFSVYGEYDYTSSLIMTCIEKMLKNEDVPLSQCIQSWDYIYVDDVAEALLKLGEFYCSSGVYNIASGLSKPLKEFVD